MKVLLFGGAGQLGTDLRNTADLKGIELCCPPHPEADITERDSVMKFLDLHSPSVVVNAAAFNLTDQCELNPEIALRANAEGPRLLAALCRELPSEHHATREVELADGGPRILEYGRTF